ncbi:MAG: 23S rRNA (adenine(2503)-C(2))-methyltransferase RlmN [Planctomycetes bacterium]|nr:23S rRNA (adenine(2503)-C(2))-methyltransferase RlmN [Planctomycetota bacterium]
MTGISLHDDAALDAVFREHRLDPYPLRRLRYLLYAERRPAREAIAGLPGAARRVIHERVRLPWLTIEDRTDSRADRSTRLVYRAPDGAVFEGVLLRATGARTSVCVSTQVGCASGCAFCGTARMGRIRDLGAHEMIDQIVLANDVLRGEGRRARNVVFMGMGEPFHNELALGEAIRRLVDPRRFSISPRKLLVSTVGVPDAMVRFARDFPLVGLAVSLHSTIGPQRASMIPLARRYPLDAIRTAMLDVQTVSRRPLMIEYLMLERINDEPDDAIRLADYLRGIWAHINLIPYNPIPDGRRDYRASPRDRRDRFARLLRERGYLTTIRHSQGSDIAAACGQLASGARVDRESPGDGNGFPSHQS